MSNHDLTSLHKLLQRRWQIEMEYLYTTDEYCLTISKAKNPYSLDYITFHVYGLDILGLANELLEKVEAYENT